MENPGIQITIDSDKKTIHVTQIELSGNDKYVTVSVTDTGIGIPLDKQKSIFDQFTKLNERSQGTGLGLALCKKIIEHYNGVIWVDNEYSKGARVVFSIPTDGMVDEQLRSQSVES